MSGRGRFGFICRSMCSSPTIFSPRPSSSPKGYEQRERVKAKLERALAASSRTSSAGFIRWSSAAGGMAGAISGERREPEQVRAIAFRVAEAIGSTGRRNVNYNWMEPGADDEDPGRSGPGPPPGPELQDWLWP